MYIVQYLDNYKNSEGLIAFEDEASFHTACSLHEDYREDIEANKNDYPDLDDWIDFLNGLGINATRFFIDNETIAPWC